MSHAPAALPEPPLLAPILGGLTLLAVLVLTFTLVWTVTEREPYDTATFCDGYANGTFYALTLAGIDPPTAAGYAADVPCAPSHATRGFAAPESWCEGFAQAYVKVGEDLDYGLPPEGVLAFVATMGAECVARGVWLNPPLTQTAQPPLGGGGSPPIER